MRFDVEKWKEIIKKNMSEKRFVHSCNVAEMSAELADIWGYDVHTAYAAGLLHDICKEFPKEVQFEYVKNAEEEFDVSPQELAAYKVWHGIAGAYFLKTKYGIDDENLLLAIRYHTVGRAEMSKLEEIVYVADMVSADRKMPCVPAIRALAKENLELAVLEELRVCMTDTISSGGSLPQCTVDAYNYYVKYLDK